MLIFRGCVKSFGSSIVASQLSTSGLRGVYRFTTGKASLWKLPAYFGENAMERAVPLRARRSNDLRALRVAVSRGFGRNQLVTQIVQLHQSRAPCAIFEVQGHSLEYIAAEFLPSLCFGEDGMA